MPIAKALESFWWFEDGAVGGLARPGFNQEAGDPLDWGVADHVVWNWVGKLHSETPGRETLTEFSSWYRDAVVPFLDLPREESEHALAQLDSPETLQSALERLDERTGLLEHADCSSEPMRVRVRPERVRRDVELLVRSGVSVLVSLDEPAPHALVREGPLDSHHLPVPDLEPPRREQVEAFAEILADCRQQRRGLAVHCMAGIGRTATMILAGHLLLGHRFAELERRLLERKPVFRPKGSQWEFLRDLARERGRL